METVYDWVTVAIFAGLIVLFLVYTWVFTWSFDRLFGLPQALR